MPYGQTSLPRYSGHHGKGVVGGVVDVLHSGSEFTDPPVATDFSYTLDSGVIMEMLGFSINFITDSNNAERKVRFEILGPDDHRFFIATFATKNANTNTDLLLAQWGHSPTDLTVAGDSNVARAPLPRKMIVPPGSTFRTATENIQPGDNFANPHALVEKFAAS